MKIHDQELVDEVREIGRKVDLLLKHRQSKMRFAYPVLICVFFFVLFHIDHESLLEAQSEALLASDLMASNDQVVTIV